MKRRAFLAGVGVSATLASIKVGLAQEGPSEEMILRRLDAAPLRQIAPESRVTLNEFKRRPDLRRAAPSIDIQAINFATGSAEIPRSEYRKVQQIARAMEQILRRRRGVRFLIEGHTDAVGTAMSNQILSERRAASLRLVLAREFGVPPRLMETVGYGEDFLLVPTEAPDWRNRRVTLRRIDDFIR
ncbi:OmpA family protein [Rhizobium sp. AG855]|uniref:OmpA family protein n=1 Tax=Rhizobium sp. AG855 TaxID=2183898 RepID=UPI000E75963A|nr:OmpA family protein [Rhizobium sp. AG855]RKE85015.1 outer membrane protein OmpA-like peptidoglycan-associated protein [Rhizobium sp. AG855]